MKLRAGLFCEIARAGRVGVGNRQEPDRRVLRRQPRAQPADAAGADDGDAQILAFDGPLPARAVILAGAAVRNARQE